VNDSDRTFRLGLLGWAVLALTLTVSASGVASGTTGVSRTSVAAVASRVTAVAVAENPTTTYKGGAAGLVPGCKLANYAYCEVTFQVAGLTSAHGPYVATAGLLLCGSIPSSPCPGGRGSSVLSFTRVGGSTVFYYGSASISGHSLKISGQGATASLIVVTSGSEIVAIPGGTMSFPAS